MQAQYPVKVQAIRSQGRTDRFYVFIPLPLAAAIGLEAGEKFQWSLSDRDTLAVRRLRPTSAVGAGSVARRKTLQQK